MVVMAKMCRKDLNERIRESLFVRLAVLALVQMIVNNNYYSKASA